MSHPSFDLWDGTEVLCGVLYPNLEDSRCRRLCCSSVALVLKGSSDRQNGVNHSLLKREERSA
jgi:hypothetical protein